MDLDGRHTCVTLGQPAPVFTDLSDGIGQQLLSDQANMLFVELASQEVDSARVDRFDVMQPNPKDVTEHVPTVAIELRRPRTNPDMPVLRCLSLAVRHSEIPFRVIPGGSAPPTTNIWRI
jgi:hypothetical protein